MWHVLIGNRMAYLLRGKIFISRYNGDVTKGSNPSKLKVKGGKSQNMNLNEQFV